MKQIRFLTLFLSHFFFRYFRRPTLHRNDFQKTGKKRLGLSSAQQKYILFFFITLAVSAIVWRTGGSFYHKGKVSEGLVGVYSINKLPPVVANLISRPLVSLDNTGRPQPELASGWQVNNNATEYTFKLRDNLFWNDGTRVKSSDIKFNLPDVEISYPDESTIHFKLADSFNPFPALLTAPVLKGNSLVGIGKFKVADADFNHGFVTRLLLEPPSPDLPQVSIRFYQDERIAKTAFELGEIESLIGVNDLVDVKDQPSIGIQKITNFNKLVAIFYNTKDPLLSDKNMRKALSAASPKVEGEERARTPIPPSVWAYNNDVREFLGDPELAKSYLSKVELPERGTITLTTTPYFASLGDKIVKSWKQAGIDAVLRVESGIPQNFQALLLSEAIPADPDQYALWHSTQSKTNISKYSSPRVDKDLEDGRKISEIEKRKENYLDFQKVLLDDSPATFLYFPKTQVIYRKKAESAVSKILPLQLPQAKKG